jgi:hypothetical protein
LFSGTNNLQPQQPEFHGCDANSDVNFATANVSGVKCKDNISTNKSRVANDTTPVHMNSNNSSIINSRTSNNHQLAPGAPSNQSFNQQQQQQQQQQSQYGNSSNNNNNYSNHNNLTNNFNMVAAGQQSGMDVGYNSQVRFFAPQFCTNIRAHTQSHCLVPTDE